ncbi:GGDEF domain-containing protein [Pseudoduganella buxea]|uniref:diguanylate cyclase n=1 Tax=Pseudoduganella buxea TaxID=1949069 RepID=A0ABQ1KUB8_9BURK|nr:GGDEF domain-containing protein [Pseudoduganella buxea]GGC07478.1 hypothetical protein GCM10011572_31400 [Pseudoduganella buxea]
MPPTVNDAVFRIARWRAEFADRTIESHFNRHQLRHTRSQVRLALLFCAAFYVAFTITDVLALGFGREALILLAGRVVVAVSALVSCAFTYWYPHSIRRIWLGASITEILGMATFALVVLFRPHDTPWHAMSISIMALVVYLYIPNRLLYALAIGVISTVVFVALVVWLDRLTGPELLTMSMLLLLSNGFGCMAAHRYALIRREEFRVHAVLKNLSERDALTGCHNRRYLQQELLNMELSRARRFKLSLAVVICDIDHFKAVNDTHGHAAGDAVLVTFANLLRSLTRDGVDSVIRYGGEEFLIVLPETDLDGAVHLAERMRGALIGAGTEVAPGRVVGVTASFGVTAVNFAHVEQRFAQELLVDQADRLLYTAKSSGRNNVQALQFHGSPGAGERRKAA